MQMNWFHGLNQVTNGFMHRMLREKKMKRREKIGYFLYILKNNKCDFLRLNINTGVSIIQNITSMSAKIMKITFEWYSSASKIDILERFFCRLFSLMCVK